MMTIGQFSERTGLRPKTLRYYEEVELLIPAIRLENGYRHYADAQVHQAQLISGLRHAGVTIAGIREFQDANQARKEELLACWREEAAAKLLSLQVANQFLNGLDSQMTHVHLTYWDQPKKIIWSPTHALHTAQDWQSSAQACHRQLMKTGLKVDRSTYVRFHDDAESTRGQMGFVIHDRHIPPGHQVEIYAPTLFATVECHGNMAFPCKPIFAAVRRFGFQPIGTPLRRYPDFSAFLDGRYLLMVPVVHSDTPST